MNAYAATNIGKVRKNNEDSIYLSGETEPVLAIVADGMGGHLAGQVASKMAVDIISKELTSYGLAFVTEKLLGRIISKASKELYLTASKDAELYQMGKTVVAGILYKDRMIYANVGDSRIYLLHRGVLTRLTHDHSFVQSLLDKNIITEEEAKNHPYKNIITRVVGMEKVQADCAEVRVEKGDVLLFCSDGLTNHVEESEIAAYLGKDDDAFFIVNELIDLALYRGGKDNISAIMIKNDGGEAR